MLWYLGYVVLFVDDFDARWISTRRGRPARPAPSRRVRGICSRGSQVRPPLAVTRGGADRGETGGKTGTRPRPSAVTVLVEDVDRVFRELSGRGVQFLGGPKDRAWGQRSCISAIPRAI